MGTRHQRAPEAPQGYTTVRWRQRCQTEHPIDSTREPCGGEQSPEEHRGRQLQASSGVCVTGRCSASVHSGATRASQSKKPKKSNERSETCHGSRQRCCTIGLLKI